MSTWSDLRTLRRQGLKPLRPLYITGNFQLCRTEAEEGAMVIVHQRGEKFEFDLLEGLEVFLRLENCEHTSRVAHRLAELPVRPKSIQAFCRCEGCYDTDCWPNCDVGNEGRAAWEMICQPKT